VDEIPYIYHILTTCQQNLSRNFTGYKCTLYLIVIQIAMLCHMAVCTAHRYAGRMAVFIY